MNTQLDVLSHYSLLKGLSCDSQILMFFRTTWGAQEKRADSQLRGLQNPGLGPRICIFHKHLAQLSLNVLSCSSSLTKHGPRPIPQKNFRNFFQSNTTEA